MNMGATILNLERLVKRYENVCYALDCEHKSSATCDQPGCDNKVCALHVRNGLCLDCAGEADAN